MCGRGVDEATRAYTHTSTEGTVRLNGTQFSEFFFSPLRCTLSPLAISLRSERRLRWMNVYLARILCDTDPSFVPSGLGNSPKNSLEFRLSPCGLTHGGAGPMSRRLGSRCGVSVSRLRRSHSCRGIFGSTSAGFRAKHFHESHVNTGRRKRE